MDDYELVIPVDNSYGALKTPDDQYGNQTIQDHLWGEGGDSGEADDASLVETSCNANFTGTLGLLECQVCTKKPSVMILVLISLPKKKNCPATVYKPCIPSKPKFLDIKHRDF